MCFIIIMDIFYCFYSLRTDFISCWNFHLAVRTWLFNLHLCILFTFSYLLFFMLFTFCFGLLVHLLSMDLCVFLSCAVSFVWGSTFPLWLPPHVSVWLCSPSCDCPNVFHLRLIAPLVSHCPPCLPLYLSLSSSLSLLVTLCVCVLFLSVLVSAF